MSEASAQTSSEQKIPNLVGFTLGLCDAGKVFGEVSLTRYNTLGLGATGLFEVPLKAPRPFLETRHYFNPYVYNGGFLSLRTSTERLGLGVGAKWYGFTASVGAYHRYSKSYCPKPFVSLSLDLFDMAKSMAKDANE